MKQKLIKEQNIFWNFNILYNLYSIELNNFKNLSFNYSIRAYCYTLISTNYENKLNIFDLIIRLTKLFYI